MKKIIVSLLVLLLFPLIVHADMGAPMIPEYEAVVTNPNGVDYYETNGHIVAGHLDYNEKITISFEYDNTGTFSLNGTEYLVYIKDITPLKEVFDLEASLKKGTTNTLEKEKYLIVLKDKVEIKKGPAEAYKGTGVTIPKGTKLNYKYYQDAYLYVTYNGTSGWINILEGAVGMEPNTVCMTVRDVDIKDSNGKVIGTVKANSLLENTLQLDPWSNSFYIKINDKEGKVYFDDYQCYYESRKAVLLKEFKLYTTADSKSEVIKTIPSNTEVIQHLAHDYDSWLYIEVDGIKGWIYYESESGDSLWHEKINYPDGVQGFRSEEFIKSLGYEGDIETPTEPSKDEPVYTDPSGLPLNELILDIVGGVILLVAVTIVTIKLVNKKKEVKKDNIEQ